MNVNKFKGKTVEEAIAAAREAYGADAVIMFTKEIKPKGVSAWFKKPTFEVTAAMKERENGAAPAQVQTQAPAQVQAPVQNPKGLHDSINVAADETINLKEALQRTVVPRRAEVQEKPRRQEKQEKQNARNGREFVRAEENEGFEDRLDSLSDRLEEKFNNNQNEDKAKGLTAKEIEFVRLLYNALVRNEVNEKYVNQILDEVEHIFRPGNSVDMILPNVYQKLILRFGQPKVIELGKKRPKVVFFIGPTGVGKTTTIAKIASKYKMEYNKNVAFITADTYRIAATEQLRKFSEILDVPMEIVYSPDELNQKMERFLPYDLVFVDTAGFSHNNETQKENMRQLLQSLDEGYAREVYLVLSATTKYRDLLDIVDTYRKISDYKLIFTKLDETRIYGNILNIKLYTQADLSYVTNGQNVPGDIEVFDTQKIVKQLLGGNG